MRRFAANVDVDSLHLYAAIHALDPSEATEAVWEQGVPRFLELFERLQIRATFFVVGSDLERAGPRRIAAQAVAAGHELASHTWSHPYNLIHLETAQIREEIEAAERIISEVRGEPVRGFRAPGYNICPKVAEILRERGYAYDSSLFPCPIYYAARAGAIAAIRLAGRRSHSIVGVPQAAFSPRLPHTYQGLLEFPMTVLPGVRLPVIGTSLTLMGTAGVRLIAPILGRLSFVNLEFHGIDLLDATDLPGASLVDHQADLRIPVARKMRIFSDALSASSQRAQNDTLESFALEQGA